MNSVLELMIEAKALIEDESKWTKGYYAHDSEGSLREALDPQAVCFCSVGALIKVAGGYDYPQSLQIDRAEAVLSDCVKISTDGWGQDIVEFNDAKDNTHQDVMAVWDKAIQMERDRA